MDTTQPVTLVNLSPHPLNFYIDGKVAFTLPATKTPARRVEEGKQLPSIKSVVDGKEFTIPLRTQVFTGVTGLPEPKVGTVYIVAYPVAESEECKQRDDIVCAGDHVRDETGFIIGRTSLAVLK